MQLPMPVMLYLSSFCSKVAVRSSKAVKEFRIKAIYGHLCNGWPRGKIVEFAKEEWDISANATDQYIARARKIIEKDCALTRQQFLAEALDRLRNYETSAAKRGQMQVATNSVRLQAELIGLTGKQ